MKINVKLEIPPTYEKKCLKCFPLFVLYYFVNYLFFLIETL